MPSRNCLAILVRVVWCGLSGADCLVRIVWCGLIGRVHLQGSSLCGTPWIGSATGRVGHSDDLTANTQVADSRTAKANGPVNPIPMTARLHSRHGACKTRARRTRSHRLERKDRIHRINSIAKKRCESKRCESKKEKIDGGLACVDLPTFPPSNMPTSSASSRHNRKSEIIAIATFIARLEVVPVDRDNPAIGQVAEGAADWVPARVADEREP